MTVYTAEAESKRMFSRLLAGHRAGFNTGRLPDGKECVLVLFKEVDEIYAWDWHWAACLAAVALDYRDMIQPGDVADESTDRAMYGFVIGLEQVVSRSITAQHVGTKH